MQQFLADQTLDADAAFSKASDVVSEFKREKKAFDRAIDSYLRRSGTGTSRKKGRKGGGGGEAAAVAGGTQG